MPQESFGELLSRFRKIRGLSQEQVANPKIGLSYSYIAMLERGQRGWRPGHPKSKPLNRDQVWYLVKQLKPWPPDCDLLLHAAGHSTDRSEEEERDIQNEFDFQELWIFARIILDPDPKWFEMVEHNILKKDMKYCYFTAKKATFLNLLNKLKKKASEKILKERLECIILPEELFLSNFAIYNPNRSNMYCCGTKTEHGKAIAFYTMRPSEAHRLYEILSDWRQHLNTEESIILKDIERIYPDYQVSKFSSHVSRI